MSKLVEIPKWACFLGLVSFAALPAIPPLAQLGRVGARLARSLFPEKREFASFALAENYKRSEKPSAALAIVERNLESRYGEAGPSQHEELFVYPQTLDWLLLLQEIDASSLARFAPIVSELVRAFGMDEADASPQLQVARLVERRDEFLALLKETGYQFDDAKSLDPKQLRAAGARLSGVHSEFFEQLAESSGP